MVALTRAIAVIAVAMATESSTCGPGDHTGGGTRRGPEWSPL
jgi:hypothetical protein